MNKILLFFALFSLFACSNSSKSTNEGLPDSQTGFFQKIEALGNECWFNGNKLTKKDQYIAYESYINSSIANNWVGKVGKVDKNFPNGYFVKIYCVNNGEQVKYWCPVSEEGKDWLYFTIRIDSEEDAKKLVYNQKIIFSGQLKARYNQIVVENGAYITE